jgi:pyruvate dehydrogenase E2 component (dihydrolipoyllysine-residue acetyltransferase)
MSVSVSMPELGESVTEGTVTRWLKKEGERVAADEALLEVSTDKVDTEIASPAAGVLREIAVDEDETVAVGTQLAVIVEEEGVPGGDAGSAPGGPAEAAAEDPRAEAPAAAETAEPTQPDQPAEVRQPDDPPQQPQAPAATLPGFQVPQQYQQEQVTPSATLPTGGDGSQVVSAPAAAPAVARSAIVPSPLRGTAERMSRLRQVISERMVESLRTSAQLTTVVEADVTAIARLRERAKAGFEAREGVKLSFLPFFALAAMEALKVHPKLNAVIDAANNQVVYHDAEHLGIAVDAERGLMVPVIRNAGDLNLAGLARKIADLAARTRSSQVSPDELAGGTFTLTNTGSRGALFDTPILNQPQVGILGTGTVVRRPVVVDDPVLGEVIAVRSVVYLALTYDHRLVDGADAARFLGAVKARLEEGAFEAELGL